MSASITREPIDAAALLASVPSASDGAVLLFLGVVRDHNQGRAVSALEYQAYEPMAAAELERIVAEAGERWAVGGISAAHRVGALKIGEASVAIAVASPHREEAYAASRYVIEELKRRLPVWKREGYLDGEREWVPGHDPAAVGGEGPEAGDG
jgi:molybdopterin synthase catalytic subunit